MPTPISNHGWSLEEPSCGTINPFEMQLPGTPIDWKTESHEYAHVTVYPGILPSNASPPPSIVLNDSFCPALSPCSSQSSNTPEVDYCDPRHLTYPTPALDNETNIDFPVLPTLSGDDEEHRLLFGGDLVSIKTEEKGFQAYGFFHDELSDLESEDEFISSFSQFSEEASPSKRQKFFEESFEESTPSSDDEFEQLPSPPNSTSTSRQGSVPRQNNGQKKRMQKKQGNDHSESDSDMTEEQRFRSFKFGSDSARRHSHESDDSCNSSSEKPAGMPINPNVIRRGRKQSLTEDPSKTFVCHLCNRRFRRQEHLKRHFRSLHTEDKPFSCGECGKKFSRSDNLTQHARIHGSGAILLGVLDENEVMDHHQQFGMPSQTMQPLGIVVVDALQAAAGAAQLENSKASEEKRNRRKRKRNDE